MSDRWKSLAEQLGAPGLDPTVRRTKEPSTSKETSAAKESRASKTDTGALRSSAAGTGKSQSADQDRGIVDVAATNNPVTNDTVTNDTADNDTANMVPDVFVQDGARKTGAAGSLANETAADLSHFTPEAATEEAPAAAPVGKPKKRSNWERLASIFSLSGDTRSERAASNRDSSNFPPSEAGVEPEAVRSGSGTIPGLPRAGGIAETEARLAEKAQAIFPAESEKDPSSHVLAELFGRSDSSPPHDSWQSPKRMVDDVGWEDDSQVSSYRQPQTEPESDSKDSLASDWLKEGKSGRGRFKRKRDNESETNLPSDQPARASGPETEKAGAQAENDDEFVAERRSSRRRRRRRDTTEVSEGLGYDREQQKSPVTEKVDSLDGLDSVDETLGQEGESTEEGLGDATAKRRRRRRRPRPARRDSESAENPASAEAAELSDQEFDDSDDDLGEETGQLEDDQPGSQKKHRSIPSWEESLAGIIDANIENHRRGDQRGYRGGGGRPRGRR